MMICSLILNGYFFAVRTDINDCASNPCLNGGIYLSIQKNTISSIQTGVGGTFIYICTHSTKIPYKNQGTNQHYTASTFSMLAVIFVVVTLNMHMHFVYTQGHLSFCVRNREIELYFFLALYIFEYIFYKMCPTIQNDQG